MRLTKKQENKLYPYIYNDIDDCFQGTPINKLGQLEDIEEDIGLPIQLVYNALRNDGGILVRNTQGLRRYTYRSCSYLTFGYDEYKGWYFTMRVKGLPQYFIKDRGKTWALTEEELL